MGNNKLANVLMGAAKALGDAHDVAQNVMGAFTPDAEPVGNKPDAVTRKVLAITYNPKVSSEGGRKLAEVMGWHHPDQLMPKHIADLHEASYGYANYTVVEHIEVDKIPVKADGFVYNPDEFVKILRTNTGFHEADAVDYHKILADFDIINRINSGAIDEVWLFAFPYAGFYESIMCGPGAFWCNAPELKNTDNANRRFVIMGYNYQRGVGEMLENMGHRAESIMEHAYRHTKGEANLWERFTRHEKKNPGQSEVGIVHYAPNSDRDYDWGNPKVVKSRYHTWKNFPNLAGEPQEVETSHWGSGEIRAHHMWWFGHFPHITGSANGVSYNWWKYVIDPNTVK